MAPTEPLATAPARNPRSWTRGLLGWAISIGCIAFIAWNVDLRGALAASRSFDWPFLLVGLASLAFGYSMRIVRWAVMLRATGADIGPGRCAAPFLGSIALNNVLPLRAGDIIRATVFPAAIHVTRSSAIGSIVMERLVDLVTLVLCLAIGAAALNAIALPLWLTEGAVLLMLLGTFTLFAIFLLSAPLARLLSSFADRQGEGSLVQRLCLMAATLLEGFKQMSGIRVLLAVFGLSALAWLGEMGLYWSLLTGFGMELGPIAALLVMAFVTLSTLVPSSPGYVGPFHLAAFSVMVLLGASEEAATSFAVLSHLMLWVPTTLAGGIAMLARPELFRSALTRPGRTAQ